MSGLESTGASSTTMWASVGGVDSASRLSTNANATAAAFKATPPVPSSGDTVAGAGTMALLCLLSV